MGFSLVRLGTIWLKDPMPDEAHPDYAEELSPNDLVLAIARDRDRAAFALLYRHFAPRLKAVLMRQGAPETVAEDLAQETMLQVWRRAETFDPSQASAATWIFTIARNRRIDRLRNERRPEIDPQDPALVPDPVVAPDRPLESAQSVERLRAAIRTLPPEQAELLQLSYFEDKPHSVIAAERKLPLGTVKSRLRLALARLKRELNDDR